MNRPRPYPPIHLREYGSRFEPAPELCIWIRETFIDGNGPLVNEDHVHLSDGIIACLWSNVQNISKQVQIAATAEIPIFRGTKWSKARQEQQLADWFPEFEKIDFLLTFDSVFAFEAADARFCYISEHELRHCGQAKDAFGSPKFNQQTGMPVFAMRDHDFTGFVGDIERYGFAGMGPGEIAAVEAALKAPKLSAEDIAWGCGTCVLQAA